VPEPPTGSLEPADLIGSHVPGDDAATAPTPARVPRPDKAASDHRAIPGYEVIDLLGRGGMAVVYKARHRDLQRTVALKMILAGAHAGPEEVARFRIEAEAVAQLQHPHIVQIYEVGQHDGCPYCAFEFVAGGTLADRLKGVPLAAEAAAQLVAQLARAIHYAHEHGIVHRDLKPGNVLLTADGQPKVTDFGLAKKLGSDLGHTRTGAVLGTPGYMAPEQAQGKRDVGPPADVYGLGAILYELLTGNAPFTADTPLDTVLRVLSEEPTPPRRLNPNVPRDLETICLKCLEKDPRRRYVSAQALADDLFAFVRGDPIAARPPGLLGRLDRWARLRPALAATLVALVFFYLNHLVLLGLGTEDEGGAFHWFVTGVVAAWAAGAAGFQWLITRGRRATAGTFGWAAFEVLMLTVFLLRGDGPRSPMLLGYLLLIAGTALRLRTGLIWFVTGLSLVSYFGLLLDAAWRRPAFQAEPKWRLVFVLSLCILGLMQYLVLRRMRSALAGDA
jgi:serine/threonine-protein kinase